MKHGSEGIMIHYDPIIAEVIKINRKGKRINSILDIGCSHGGGVKAFWNMGIKASGVDISYRAVEMARERQGNHSDMCVDKCWQSASATTLPFSNSSFDALVSTDVLEHLEPDEVSTAVNELARVARTWMFLKISNRGESSRMDRIKAPFGKDTFAKVVRERYNRDLPPQLHTTVHDAAWWISKFQAVGFFKHHTINLAYWACCGFVLRRMNTN